VIRQGDANLSFKPDSITDHAPILTGPTTLSIAENETTIATLLGTDADGDTLTYTLSGTDESSFSISSSGVIAFNSAPDHAYDQTSYTVKVTVSDGVNEVTKTLTVNVTQRDYQATPEKDPGHTKGVYSAKHCFFVDDGDINRWLGTADLTDAQKEAVYQDGQSIEINGSSYEEVGCNGDIAIRHEIHQAAYPEWANWDGEGRISDARDGHYGVSFYSRIMEDAEQIPTGTHGVWGQWLQPNRMHPGITFQSIEGGLGVDRKFGRSKFPHYMANGASHVYNPNSSVQGWGFYERRISCEYYGSVHIANKMLYPPNQIKFDEDQDDHANNGGIFFGHGWIALPMIGGKERAPNNTPGAGEEDRSVSNGKLTWTFFADAKNFSGPLHAYVPEFWYRRLEKLNATEILDEIGYDSSSAAADAARDVYAGRITEDEFISVIQSESWYSDGTSGYESGPYYARKKDTMAFNSVYGVAIGDERDEFWGFTESDESGNLYLKTNLPQIPSTSNLEPFTLSGRFYTREYYNNFVNFFNSEDNTGLNLDTLMLTEPLRHTKTSEINGFYSGKKSWGDVFTDTGESVPGKHDFKIGISVHVEKNNRGGDVYFDWQNSADRGYSKYYKINEGATYEDYTFEKVTENEVPEKLKDYEVHNLDYTTSIMPHVEIEEQRSLVDQVEADTKEIFNMDVEYLDYSCWACLEENGCDSKVFETTLGDGSKIKYRWYKFKDQPTMVMLKKEFPDIYTTEYVNALQAKIEFIHGNWYADQDFLTRPSSANEIDVKLAEIDNGLLVNPPSGKELGWVPIVLSVEMPFGKWQTEIDTREVESYNGSGKQIQDY